jgi:hypothetical protein
MPGELRWARGPISGRLILHARNGELWPRAELFAGRTGEIAVVLFVDPEAGPRVVGHFTTLIQAQAAAEQALLPIAGEEPHAP